MSEQSLRQFLADQRGEAQVLRRNGHTRDADRIDRICDGVVLHAEDYITPLSEADAMLWSGKSLAWLRARFSELERDGHAYHDDQGRRFYYQHGVPRRANPVAARREGQRSA